MWKILIKTWQPNNLRFTDQISPTKDFQKAVGNVQKFIQNVYKK